MKDLIIRLAHSWELFALLALIVILLVRLHGGN